MIDYTKITEEEFERRLNALPKEMRDFVTSAEFKGYVADLASAYDENVDEDVLDAFAQVMLYAILGFIKPNELPEEMLNLTKGDKELANEMAADMNELVATLLEPAQTYTPPVTKFSSSPETRSFIPPKSNLLKTKSVMSSPDIHPENIIDLKDLPR